MWLQISNRIPVLLFGQAAPTFGMASVDWSWKGGKNDLFMGWEHKCSVTHSRFTLRTTAFHKRQTVKNDSTCLWLAWPDYVCHWSIPLSVWESAHSCTDWEEDQAWNWQQDEFIQSMTNEIDRSQNGGNQTGTPKSNPNGQPLPLGFKTSPKTGAPQIGVI